MDLLSNAALGLEVALSTHNLLYCLLGVSLGMLFGAIPGIGVLSAVSMLFPITLYLDSASALIMLAGIWYGTTYGGNVAAILLNIPGTPSNAVTCIDGYPLARQGRGGLALLMTTIASFSGGTIGIVILMLFSPAIARYALAFGPAEYFSLMMLGLIAASTISSGSMVKGLAMVVLGILFGCVGADVYTGALRFTFGFVDLSDSISIVALAMGIFGVTEVIYSIRIIQPGDIDPSTVTFRSMRPKWDDLKRSRLPILRGAGIGSFFGALPGTGPAIAAFVAYAIEKRVARDPSRFGKGAIEGITGPESANNAADQTAFIPTLSLGIPGSPTMALMLGALMVHGITPGPGLVTEEPELFWGLVMSFWIGNLMLLVLNLPLVGIWVRMLLVPYHLLFPAVLVFICIGTYAVNLSAFEVQLVAFFAVVGVLMRIFEFPAPPLLLGFVLGPLIEENFRRALLLSDGDFVTFFDRPISGTVMGFTVLVLLWGIWSGVKHRFRPTANAA